MSVTKRILNAYFQRVDQDRNWNVLQSKTRKIQFYWVYYCAALSKTDVLKVGQLTNLSIVSPPTCAQARACLPIYNYYAAQAGVRAGVQVTFTFSAGHREACWPLGVQGLLKISLFKIFQPPFCLASQCRWISAHKKVLGFLEKFKRDSSQWLVIF